MWLSFSARTLLKLENGPRETGPLSDWSWLKRPTAAPLASAQMPDYQSVTEQDVSEWLVCLNNFSVFVCVVTFTTM